MSKARLSRPVNTMVTEDLAMKGGRASICMALLKSSRVIPVLASEELMCKWYSPLLKPSVVIMTLSYSYIIRTLTMRVALWSTWKPLGPILLMWFNFNPWLNMPDTHTHTHIYIYIYMHICMYAYLYIYGEHVQCTDIAVVNINYEWIA